MPWRGSTPPAPSPRPRRIWPIRGPSSSPESARRGRQWPACATAASTRAAIRNGVPFLGICLGMQVLFEWSAEDGAACLGVLPGTVERMKTQEKLPHVGWNTLEHVRPHPVLDGMEGEAFYFVHSYVVVPRSPAG